MDPADERVLWVGPQAESLLGYPRERWLKPGLWDVIVVEGDRRRVREARAAGASAFFRKPFPDEDLFAAIAEVTGELFP